MSDRNIVTAADARDIAKSAVERENAQTILVARAVLATLIDSFTTYRPSIDNALQAMADFDAALQHEGVDGITWRRIRTELDFLAEIEGGEQR